MERNSTVVVEGKVVPLSNAQVFAWSVTATVSSLLFRANTASFTFRGCPPTVPVIDPGPELLPLLLFPLLLPHAQTSRPIIIQRLIAVLPLLPSSAQAGARGA